MTTYNSKGIEKLTGGVFYSSTPFDSNSKVLEGKVHHRFMNYFMIDKETHLLSEDQVFKICEKRDHNPHIIGKTNEKVKERIKKFIIETNPRRVLEIGSGLSPLSFSDSPQISLTISDANPKIVEEHRQNSRDCILLGNNTNNFDEYKNHFDIIAAVFVLHFKVDRAEIRAIRELLNEDGVFIANIYRLSCKAKSELEANFKLENLHIEKIKDTSNICKNHEYWICGNNKISMKNKAQAITRSL